MRGALGLVFLLASATLWSLGPEVHDAVVLELQGRLSEAREAYRTVLLSHDLSLKATTESTAQRVFLLKKLGHLAVDLGTLEEAWDVSLQLRVLGTSEALRESSSLRGRILQPRAPVKDSPWAVLPSPATLAVNPVPPYARLQLGAFADWNHVRTQLDILLEKGWSPWCEERKVGKDRLVAVFVVSHEATADLARLKVQGFTPTVSAIDVRS